MKFLVDHWVTQFKSKVSIKLAAVYAAITTILVTNQTLTIGLLAVMPTHGVLWWLSVLFVLVVTFGIPTLAVLWRQPKLTEKIEEKNNG